LPTYVGGTYRDGRPSFSAQVSASSSPLSSSLVRKTAPLARGALVPTNSSPIAIRDRAHAPRSRVPAERESLTRRGEPQGPRPPRRVANTAGDLRLELESEPRGRASIIEIGLDSRSMPIAASDVADEARLTRPHERSGLGPPTGGLRRQLSTCSCRGVRLATGNSSSAQRVTTSPSSALHPPATVASPSPHEFPWHFPWQERLSNCVWTTCHLITRSKIRHLQHHQLPVEVRSQGGGGDGFATWEDRLMPALPGALSSRPDWRNTV